MEHSRNDTMNNEQEPPSALPMMILFAWIVLVSTLLCIFFYLSATVWK